MVLAERFKGLSTKKKTILIASVTAVVAGAVIICVLLSRGYYATTMRLLRVEGTVNIEDADGNPRSVMENVRFSSGEALSTGADGLASVGLDDTKIVTLESDSRVEFTKSRNMLELNLTRGGLFFEVTEHLSPDETFDIRTSTMTVGIRGTSGYVFYDDDGREALIITDGCVHVVATNPDTGETRETDVSGGYKVKVYLYDESRAEGSVEFFLEELAEDEIPGFPLAMLAENPVLLDRVCEDTGWSREEILNLAAGIIDTEETAETSETSEPDETEPELTPAPPPDDDDETEPSDTPTPSPRPTPSVSVTPAPEPESDGDDVTPTVTPTPVPTLTPAPASSQGDDTSGDPSSDSDTTPAEALEPEDEEDDEVEEVPVNPYEDENGNPYYDDYPGYDQSVWGRTYDSHSVFIIERGEIGSNNHEVYVYLGNGVWHEAVYMPEMMVEREDGLYDCSGYYYYDDDDNYVVYYATEGEPVDLYYEDGPEDPLGYSTVDHVVWGEEYEGHSVYIVFAGNDGGAAQYMCYYNDKWYPCRNSYNEYEFTDDDGSIIVYYRY